MKANTITTAVATKRMTARMLALVAMLVLTTSLFSATAYAEDGQGSSPAQPNVGADLRAGVQPDSTDRAKRTVMFYVCGSNLEEDGGLASMNIQQVLETNFGDGEDIRFIVMTGGSSKWYLDNDDNEENDNGYLVFPEDVTLPEDAVVLYNPSSEDDEDEGDGEGDGEGGDGSEGGESEPVLLNPKSQISGPYNQIWEARSAGAADNPGKLVLLDGNGLTDSKAADTEEWMSDPETLRAFIDYGVENFPADKYDLILWDHGGGTTGGFALDFRRPQTFFGSNTMRFPEILSALKGSKVVDGNGDGTQDGTFDFVNFDACLMGSTEIALALADWTDYYIASPEEIPGYGEIYSGWLGKLGQNPDTDTRELCTTLVDDYFEFYNAGYDDGTRDEATLAFIDTKALLDSGFVDALGTIGETLVDQVENAQFYDEFRSVKGSIRYHNCSFYDLGNLVSQLGMALWELDADNASEDAIDTKNAYTEAAQTVLGVLQDPKIIYARNTSGMQKEARFFVDVEGNPTSGTLEPSGLQLYFPFNIYNKDVIDYDKEISDAIALMPDDGPDDGRTEFLRSYVKAMYDYNFIQVTGKAVTEMVNSGYDASSIDYDALKEYWLQPEYPDIPELGDACEWNDTIVRLFEAMGDGDPEAGEDDAQGWLDTVIQQQAAEAISAENVTAQSVLMDGGTGSKVAISNTRRRAVDNVRMSVTAELPAAINYVHDHEDTLEYLLEGDNAQIELDTVNATTDLGIESIGSDTGDFIRDSINHFNTATTTNWILEPPTSKAYAIRDANGKLHAALAEIEPGKCIVPFIRERSGVTNPNELEMLLFGFENGKVSLVYLTDDAGNRRIVRASDLKTELQLMPALCRDEFSRTRLLPISASSFTVTPENIGDIELVYTDVRDIHDIADADGDGVAFNYKYEVTDIYGSQIDITEKVKNPEGSLISIMLAQVEPAQYTGQELVPQVTYNGKTLVEGQDYDWTRNDVDDPIVLPGDYGVTIIGEGEYTGMMITTFNVIATTDDLLAAADAEEAILAALAGTTPEALDAGDADALAAVDAALATYAGLTEAQRTQIGHQTVMALLAASQKASAARNAAAGRIDLSDAEVSVAKATYTGKALKPNVTVTLGGKTLEAGTDYTVTYANNTAAGTGVAIVKGTGSYTGAAASAFTIGKANNTLTVKAKTAKVKHAKAKKKNVKLSAKKVVVASKAKGKVTYKKAKGNKKIKVSKTGKVTVKKGIKKGTYKVKVKVTAAGNANYKKLTRTVTFKVKVA